jgi:hypothetical protein
MATKVTANLTSNLTGGSAPAKVNPNSPSNPANQAQTGQQGNTGGTDNSGYEDNYSVGGGSTASTAASRAAAQAAQAQQAEIDYTRATLDSKENALRSLLGQYDAAENTGKRTIQDNYNTSLSQAQKDYGAQRTTNDINKQKAYENVDQKARTDWGGLRRMLGSTGAANESAGLAARMAVARQSSADRDSQTQTFGQNSKNITDAEAKFTGNLNKEKAQKEEALIRSLLESRNSIQSQLADAAMQKSYLNGDNYETIRGAANGYQSAIDANTARLNTLPDQFRSAYNTVIDPATLSDFTVDQTAIDAQAQGADKEYSPYSLLRKKVLDQTA